MYAAFQHSSAFEFDYSRFCAELRAALKGTGTLSPEDDHFLKDGADRRHRHATIQRLRGLAARSPMPAHHEALSELVRPCIDAPCFVEASTAETLSTGPTDVAQYDFFRAPCRSTAERLKGALLHQQGTTNWLLRALLMHRVWQ